MIICGIRWIHLSKATRSWRQNFLPKAKGEEASFCLNEIYFSDDIINNILFERYVIPDNPFSIPASSSADTFNSLIKSILKSEIENQSESNNLNEDLNDVEFDFYINGDFLHTNLSQFIESNENIKTVSAINDINCVQEVLLKDWFKESIIEIEYVERCPPPEPLDTIIVDDWVSSIRGYDDW